MTLPVAQTLKLILALRPPGQDRLAPLFAELQCRPAPRPAHLIEDEIWACWIAHADPALEARMQRAISATARRRFTDAERLLDDLVGDAPDWAEAWNKRATLYFLTRRDAESVADICTTLQHEPRHFGAICGFGQICLRHGETAAAASAFAAALQINPHLDTLRVALAEIESMPSTRLH